MKEDEIYLEIAKRYIKSCDHLINNGSNLQEVIGFKAYHAFESLGGAFNSHYGLHIPKGHLKKINAFVTNSRHCKYVTCQSIATVSMLLSSNRNKYLYPENVGGVFKSPQDQLSMTDAKLIVSRVKGILKNIDKLI
ncbi:hypothetical protein GVN16_13820 [Emticicia sp. CRIBPO]|uniref:hypothetical protein n=1 Tax=Emticicia sp. CRIBPO TaxID=2683258 RepID=UPI0014124FDF|nr:hypothetical protein [Emticicia sp. CRIBPO]NBA86848.1 hypothetical protein [Emticicia sp. CRIBPO]